MVKKKNKFKPGDLVTSVNELMSQDFVYWRGSLIPFGWFQNWQIAWAQFQINNKLIRRAIKIEEEK